MTLPGDRRHYRALSVDDNDTNSDLSEKLTSPKETTATYQYIILWLCIASTVVNVVALVISRQSSDYRTSPALDKKYINTLRRPSQYIGFDTISRPSPPSPRNFTNYPILSVQIDGAQPHKVFESDLRRFMALSGTVYPDDKKMVIAGQISTIVQFRAIDYGMEDCEIHVTLPPASGSTQYIEAVSVYRLEVSSPLNLQTLSHSTAPRRAGKLADIRAVAGEETHWYRKQSCALEELLSFELACPSDMPFGTTCSLEWWQHKEETVPAVYMVQHATV